MSAPTFRGDPYRVFDVRHDASAEEIKARWRELAREHHPDRAGGDSDERERLTTRMARINAAYDVLSDPVRRARYDATPHARRERYAEGRAPGSDEGIGPPPPPPSKPVTARFDFSSSFKPRNSAAIRQPGRQTTLSGQAPVDWREYRQAPDLRASRTGQCTVGSTRRARACPAWMRPGPRSSASGASMGRRSARSLTGNRPTSTGSLRPSRATGIWSCAPGSSPVISMREVSSAGRGWPRPDPLQGSPKIGVERERDRSSRRACPPTWRLDFDLRRRWMTSPPPASLLERPGASRFTCYSTRDPETAILRRVEQTFDARCRLCATTLDDMDRVSEPGGRRLQGPYQRRGTTAMPTLGPVLSRSNGDLF